MASIIIGFSRSRSPWKIGSRLIQISEKRPFSHAYFRYTCPISGKQIVNQASHGYINEVEYEIFKEDNICLLYTSPSPRDRTRSRMPSSA